MPRRLKDSDAVGFPPPLLGEAPLRLPVLNESGDWLALNKPVGVATRAHPWYSAPDLDAALNGQLSAGKPELTRREATLFGSVYHLDPEISGIALFAKNRDALARLKNAFGSGELRFRFLFVAHHGLAGMGGTEQADAPLLPHNVKPKMIPSTAKGKKALTHFRRRATAASPRAPWALWEAETTFFRPHQVRCHAGMLGIPVLGDGLYGGPPAPKRVELQPKKRGGPQGQAAFSGLGLHLEQLSWDDVEEGELRITAPLTKHFALLIRRMGLFR